VAHSHNTQSNNLAIALAPGEPIVRVRSLGKQVSARDGKLVILRGVDLDLAAGESLAVQGVSGSGKSTLLGLIAGLDVPTEGSVRLAGVELFALNEDQRAALRGQLVGFVFQSFQLLPALTAVENVMLPLELARRSDAGTVARSVLGRVGLSARLDHYPRQLSGGEQQRVAIARAFAPGPGLLLADEPTGNLDTRTGRQVIDLLFELNRERGATLVLVTHDAALAERCDRKLRLDGGRLIAE
jgi:putative ABC transport system ATP-binding protein